MSDGDDKPRSEPATAPSSADGEDASPVGWAVAEKARAPAMRPVLGLVVCAALVALLVSWLRSVDMGTDRTAALASVLGQSRGLEVDPAGVLWLDQPPFTFWHSAAGSRVPVVVRAAPGEDEPHDIYLVYAKLSPKGVLLDVGGAYNLTETSAVDEQRPVGAGSSFAFVEQPLLSEPQAAKQQRPSRIRLIDLGGQGAPASKSWTRLQQAQAAITRLQDTGRLGGVGRWTYSVQPPPQQLGLSLASDTLVVDADGRRAGISLGAPAAVPDWLSVETPPERRPGNLVTWAVDRVRAVPWIGDETMQLIKGVAYEALDVVLSSKEELTGDTGEEDIAADLGQETLEPPTRALPVDPEIGFPPPPLEPWVKPTLAGEGVWRPKDKDPFIHNLPGLPSTFVTTFIRGDRRRKATRVYIALWDPRLVQLNTMAGLAEPKSATGETGPGLIPREPAVMRRVAAAFNSGFQSLHGEYGMMSDGVVYLPPKPYGATVAVMRDGSTAFGSWPLDTSVPDELRSYRQNMTVMVLDQKWNPYGRTWWGGTPSDWEDKTHTVRTGICLTKESFVGYFYGADLSPRALAQAMIQARCSYGVALDMNAGHSGLEFYKVAPKDELPPLGRPLRWEWEREGKVRYLEGWHFRARRLIRGMGLMNFPRYIGREGRDYFYLTLRYVLPGAALAAGGKDDKAQGWQVKGLPQHGFPYALAKTGIKLPSGLEALVLKVDPRMLTTSADRAHSGKKGGPAVVMAVARPENKGPALWLSSGAFAGGTTPPVDGAVRLLSGRPPGSGKGAAAACVQDVEGMLVYLQPRRAGAEAEPAVAADQELASLLRDKLGCSTVLVLDKPLALALGGDTSLTGEATRLPAEPPPLLIYRGTSPGSRRIFDGTPIVPLKEWYPLQARRIRYFKKKKKKSEPT